MVNLPETRPGLFQEVITFSDTVNFGENLLDTHLVDVAVFNDEKGGPDTVLVLWVQVRDELGTGARHFDYYLSKSADGGSSFAHPIEVEEAKDLTPFFAAMEARGDNVVISYEYDDTYINKDSYPYTDGIGFLESSDGGKAFTADSTSYQIFTFPSGIGKPAYVLTGQSASRVYSNAGADANSIIGHEVFVPWSNDDTPRAVAVGDQLIYAVWTRYTEEIEGGTYFARSDDGGQTFTEARKIDKLFSVNSFPDVAAIGTNTVFVAWHELYPTGILELFVAKSHDRGMTFGTPVSISNSTYGYLIPKIALAERGSDVYIIWMESPGSMGDENIDIFMKKSLDGGRTFGRAENVSNSLGHSLGLTIVATDDEVFLGWQDDFAYRNWNYTEYEQDHYDALFRKGTERLVLD